MPVVNLAEEWRKLDATRRKPDSQAHWDKRAETFSFKDAPDSYLQAFIAKAGITGAECVLDMGCGTGSLAVALASKGCSVVAADFSEGMLSRLRANARARGMLSGGAGLASQGPSSGKGSGCALDAGECAFPVRKGKITPLRMSWEDEWQRFGLGVGSVDVAVASRSLITHDLEDSLRKLSCTARKRVCVTVGTGVSPRVDMRVAKAMGLQLERHNDALFVFGIASDLGYEPTVSYIHSPRTKLYDSPDEAYCSLLGIKEYVADASQQVSDAECAANLRLFLEEHLVETEQNGTRCWMLDEPRIVPWAFISWEV